MEADRIGSLTYNLPHFLVETFYATVKTVAAVVDWQLIRLAIERETTIFDAVGKSTNYRIEIRFFIAPFLPSVKTKHYVSQFTLLIRCIQAHNLSTIIGNLHAHTIGVTECHELHPALLI